MFTAWNDWVHFSTGMSLELRDVQQDVDEAYFAPHPAPSASGGNGSLPSKAPTFPTLGQDDYEIEVGDRLDGHASAYAEWSLVVSPRVTLPPGLRVDVFVSGTDVALGLDPRLRARYQL